MQKLRILIHSTLTLLLLYVYVPINIIEKEVQPYVKEFEKYCPKYFYSKHIYFKKFKDDTIGDCLVFPINPWKYRIRLDREHWVFSNDHERRMVIFHELTHAVGLDHTEDENHYMYYRKSYTVTEQMLHEQMLEFAKKHCK